MSKMLLQSWQKFVSLSTTGQHLPLKGSFSFEIQTQQAPCSMVLKKASHWRSHHCQCICLQGHPCQTTQHNLVSDSVCLDSEATCQAGKAAHVAMRLIATLGTLNSAAYTLNAKDVLLKNGTALLAALPGTAQVAASSTAGSKTPGVMEPLGRRRHQKTHASACNANLALLHWPTLRGTGPATKKQSTSQQARLHMYTPAQGIYAL